MEPPEEPVSGEKLDVAAPGPRVATGSPSTAKPAPARASPRTRAKAPPAKKAPKAAKKAAPIPPKASDTVGAAGEMEQERPLVDGAAASSAPQPLQPLTEAGETPIPSCPPDGAREEVSQPQLPVVEPAQPSSLPPASTPLPPESPSEEPAAKTAKPATPEAAVPPATAGLCPKKAPKAVKKAAPIPPKASDTVGAAGEKEQERPLVDGAAASSAPQPLQPLTEAGETPSPSCPPDGAREEVPQPQLPVMEPAQPSSLPPASTPLPLESPLEEPAAKRAKPATPEAAVPPAAAGLCPKKAQEPEMTAQMRQIISEAIAKGIAAGIQQHLPASSAASNNALCQGQTPLASMSIPESLKKDLPLSEDKGGTPDHPTYIGLFSPALFKTLLQKAKAAAGIGGDPASLDPALPHPINLLFSESATEKEEVPCPKIFLEIIQRQWIQPGTFQSPSGYEIGLYNMEPNLTAALETPKVDGPLAAPNSILCNYADALMPEDKKAELSLSRAHQSSAWAIKSATAASFFNRISLLWLKQMQARIPATDLQTHEDISNLIAAAEFSADATLNSAKFASRAIGLSLTARRMLWLRGWKSSNKLKWRLASSSFKGDKLFGPALEQLLVETKDKKKVLPATFKNPNKQSSSKGQKPSVRGKKNAQKSSQPQRAYVQRPVFQPNRPGYGDRSGQQFQSKRPYRGNGSRPFLGSSRGLHKLAQILNFRGPAATMDWSPKGFEEVESDYPPNTTQQTSAVQEIQNPTHSKEYPGGRHPDVNRSQRNIPTRPYIADSPTTSMDMQHEAVFPVQSPQEDSSYALGSSQDYPYSRPTISGRHVDRIVLSPPHQRGSTQHDSGPSGSFRESGIHSQEQQEPLASYRQDAPSSSIYRDDIMHSLPVPARPGQHQRSGEADPNGASRPRLTIVRKDGVVRLHCSRGTSGYQDPTMVPSAYPEIPQEQFSYQRASPVRSPPVADATDRNQGMPVPGNKESRHRYGRWISQLESPDRDQDGRRSGDRRGMTNQPGRDPSRPRSPPMDPDHHLRPPRTSPSRERSHQGPYEPQREYPLQMDSGRRRKRTEPS